MGIFQLYKKIIQILAVVAILALMIPVQTQAETTVMKPLVVIDPGHGGKYSGTSGYSGSKTGYYEERANLEVSLRLRSLLVARGYEVFMTRTEDVHFSSTSAADDLKARTELSNANVKGRNDNSVFISIHHNASTSPFTTGYSTFYFDSKQEDPNYKPDPLQIIYSPESYRLAKMTHESVINSKANTEFGQGIMHKSFYVTRNAQIPAILAEVEFMSNPTAESKVKTAQFQQGIATALANGIDKYFGIFEVKTYKDVIVKSFTTKDQAVAFAKTQGNVLVFDKKAGKSIFDNIVYDYRAYDAADQLAQTKFVTEKDAIAFASKYNNTRVVHHPTGEVKWSNHMTKKYSVIDENQKLVDKHYQVDMAEESATSVSKATLMNTENNLTLWSSIVPQSFEVRHKERGTLKSFYDKATAQSYSTLWPGTTVYDKSTKKVIYTNPTITTPKAVSQTLSASTRYFTAIEISKSLYPKGFEATKAQKTVVMTTAFGYADALSAGPLAMHNGNAPILLNSETKLNSEVLAEIKRLRANKVILVGGENVLSAKVVDQLKAALPKVSIERLAGKTRYDTNAIVNSKLPDAKGIFIVNGTKYPDALSATSIAVTQGWHIVLTNGSTYTKSIDEQIFAKQTVIVGGTSVISNNLEENIKQRAGSDYVNRVAGATRYGTNAALIEHFSEIFTSPTFVVSTGKKYPDGLVSSSLSGRYNAPLFLVGDSISSELKPAMTNYLAERVTTKSIYTGGIVPTAVKKEIDLLKIK